MLFYSLGSSAEGTISFSFGGLGEYTRPEPSHGVIISFLYKAVKLVLLVIFSLLICFVI